MGLVYDLAGGTGGVHDAKIIAFERGLCVRRLLVIDETASFIIIFVNCGKDKT